MREDTRRLFKAWNAEDEGSNLRRTAGLVVISPPLQGVCRCCSTTLTFSSDTKRTIEIPSILLESLWKVLVRKWQIGGLFLDSVRKMLQLLPEETQIVKHMLHLCGTIWCGGYEVQEIGHRQCIREKGSWSLDVLFSPGKQD